MTKNNRKRIAFILVGLLLLGTVTGYAARDAISDAIYSTFIYEGTSAEWELKKIRRAVSRGSDKSESQLRQECFKIASENAGEAAQVTGCVYLAQKWPESDEGKKALEMLIPAVREIDITELARALQEVHPWHGARWQELAVELVERVRQNGDHPDAATLLCNAAIASRPDTHAAVAPRILMTIADMVQESYATSPDISNFCESVGNQGKPASWSTAFEPHLRHILEVNQDRFVRCSALYFLANVVQSGGVERQEDAKRLYEDYLGKFDGKTEYHAQSIEVFYRDSCQRALAMIERHGLSKKAPVTTGSDLDGNEIALEDFRGRVVLISFWASWCRPCLECISIEKQLNDDYDADKFAILGMNVDKDRAKAKAVEEKYHIDWPSLWTKGEETVWVVNAFPTFYLIDQEGVIKYSWTGAPPIDQFKSAINALIVPATHE